MNTSPIKSWEGVEAYFTFGPNSLGVWVVLILAVALFIGFIAYTIRHEKHCFEESLKLFPELQKKLDVVENARRTERTGGEIYAPVAQAE
ncbi:hypothetical protein [Cohnella sp.]|uniref:hypothetical protein n=1 Tax=Cohnella sp. TaxID=1883426 RepID=UPI003564AB61